MRDAALAIIREIGVETGGSNIQFAINPANGEMIAIEMNPRVVALLRPGLQGDRLPHRQDRRQAGGRLPARRTAQRHHPRDAGLLRADHRLRRHQGAALGVREIPRRRPDADDADEVGRRDDGHRPNLQGIAAKGAARPGDGQFRPGLRSRRPLGHARPARPWTRSSAGWRRRTAERIWYIRYAFKAGMTLEDIHKRHEDRPVVPGATSVTSSPWRSAAAPARLQAAAEDEAGTRSLLLEAKQHGFSDRQLAHLWASDRGGGAPAPQAAGRRCRLTSASIPAPRSSRRTRPTTIRHMKVRWRSFR